MSRLVLENITFFNSKEGNYEYGKTIVSKDKQIAWIGDSSSFEKEENDMIIDGDGKFVLPGLIDSHVHISLSLAFMMNMERFMLRTKDAMYGYYALQNAQKYLPWGFTTIRDCGAWGNWGPSLRRAIDQGMFVGPRISVANKPISQWGNQEEMGPSYIINAIKKEAEVLSGADGVRHAVRDRKRSGADFIKTMTTGGVLHGMESKLDRSLWTLDELEVMVDEANRLGMHVAVHAHGYGGVTSAVTAGVRSIEHGSMITEEAADLMVKQGTYLVPTHSPEFLFSNPKIKEVQPPEVLEKATRVVVTISNYYCSRSNPTR
ncbi:MAG: amidohydrolase family protein [Candidatus Kariarchaeaceae archaeon]|jgi:imidazolonepropionase-like amidohydrolase